MRLLLALLVLLNSGFLAAPLLISWGVVNPAYVQNSLREPDRISQQVHPEKIRLVNDVERAALEKEQARRVAQLAALAKDAVVLTTAKQCLHSGPLEIEQLPALRKTLQANFAETSWSIESVTKPAVWHIYMGKYPNTATLQRKMDEVDRLKSAAHPIETGPLALGLSLGKYPTPEAANGPLERLRNRGIRSARLVKEREAQTHSELRLVDVTNALQTSVGNVQLALGANMLRLCGP